jgi:hypothetical protein
MLYRGPWLYSVKARNGALRNGVEAMKISSRVTSTFCTSALLAGLFTGTYLSSPALVFGESSSLDGPSYGQTLAERFGCWGDDGKTHPVPTHVLATRENDTSVRYYGAKITDDALDAVLKDGDSLAREHLYSITAFCP